MLLPPLSQARTLNCRGRLLVLDQPIIMGILNLTPDSFSDGGKFTSPQAAVDHTGRMLAAGATVIDVGAYSSRPGGTDISVDEELYRLASIAPLLRATYPEAFFSIDTFREPVAAAMLEAGFDLVNDISAGLHDAAMFATCVHYQAPCILMHMQGTPQTMQQNPQYADIVQDVWAYFVQRINAANAAGLYDIILDPGFGFGKTLAHNYQLFAGLRQFSALELPLLIGISRKSMLSNLFNTSYKELKPATAALHLEALQAGVCILRVHDVAEAQQVCRLHQALTHGVI